MSGYTVDYSSGDRVLSVKPVQELYEIISATIGGVDVSPVRLDKLIADVRLLFVDSNDESITPTSSSPPLSEGESESEENVFVTPVKKKSNPTVQSSPTSVIDDLEVSKKLYDSKFIDALATAFFASSALALSESSKLEPHQPILLSIEGNIGAGKSTLLRALREKHPNWTFIDEPLDTWTALKNEKGNLLECFYGDQDRWAYTFQNCSILSRFQLIEDAIQANKDKFSGKHIYVTERSLGTDYHVFSKMLKEDGKLDEVEFELYERWLSELEKTCTPLSGVVWVDTPPEVCSDRIKKRSRDGEEGIPLAYLENLHIFQSRWLNSIDIPCRRTLTVEGIEQFVDVMLST